MAVDDIDRTIAFYTGLGFGLYGKPNSELVCVSFGDGGFVINFFLRQKLLAAMNGPLADLSQGAEIMFSLSAETKEEVDSWVPKVEAAGGSIFRPPSEDGRGFYYCGFADPDGHKYNVLLMKAGM